MHNRSPINTRFVMVQEFWATHCKGSQIFMQYLISKVICGLPHTMFIYASLLVELSNYAYCYHFCIVHWLLMQKFTSCSLCSFWSAMQRDITIGDILMQRDITAEKGTKLPCLVDGAGGHKFQACPHDTHWSTVSTNEISQDKSIYVNIIITKLINKVGMESLGP